jgi:hypothetical protein
MAEDERSAEPEAPAVSQGWEDAAVIEGQVELTLSDFSSAVPHLPGFKRGWQVPAILVGALLVFNLINPMPLTSLLPAGFMAVLLLYFQVLGRKAWAKRAFSDLGGGVSKFRFDDYGLSVESSLRQHRLAWVSLAQKLETPESFVVFSTPQTLFVIPKRAFKVEQVDALRQLCLSRIVPRPEHAPPGSPKRLLFAWLAVIIAFLAIWHFLNTDDAPAGTQHKTRHVRTE